MQESGEFIETSEEVRSGNNEKNSDHIASLCFSKKISEEERNTEQTKKSWEVRSLDSPSFRPQSSFKIPKWRHNVRESNKATFLLKIVSM